MPIRAAVGAAEARTQVAESYCGDVLLGALRERNTSHMPVSRERATITQFGAILAGRGVASLITH
jgi:hypothetical protein